MYIPRHSETVVPWPAGTVVMNEAPYRLATIVLALGISGLILGITISFLPIVKIDFAGEPLELSIDTVRLKNVQVSSWPGKFFGAILGLYISTQLILIIQSLYYKNKIIINHAFVDDFFTIKTIYRN